MEAEEKARLEEEINAKAEEVAEIQNAVNELFIPFSFFVGLGRRSYENVYLHFLKFCLSCFANRNHRKENHAI